MVTDNPAPRNPARINISSGSPFEPVMGFCRAVAVGDRVFVSGSAPIWPDGSVNPDPEAQATRCIDIIEAALAEAGGTLADVVRTRVYLTDVTMFEAVARGHGARFADIRPANTTVVVSALLNPAWVVEIEAEAVIGARA